MSSGWNVSEIRRLYEAGRNILAYFREREHIDLNTETAILHSNDLQAGSYFNGFHEPVFATHKEKASRKLASVLDDLQPMTLLEAGVGEASILGGTLRKMRHRPEFVSGFDISLSRLLFARDYLETPPERPATLFTSTLSHISLSDNSVDVTFTHHSIEPNGGREREILSELLRVTRRALVMIEPSWELGPPETRARIEEHRYVKDLPGELAALGAEVTVFEKWNCDGYPENEAALIIVEKGADPAPDQPTFISPVSGQPLQRYDSCWHSAEDGHAFPIIGGVSCLLRENGILAVRLPEAEAARDTTPSTSTRSNPVRSSHQGPRPQRRQA